MVRLYLVLGTSFARQAPNPMMQYDRPDRVTKLVTKLAVRAPIPQYGGVDSSRLAHFMLVIDFW